MAIAFKLDDAQMQALGEQHQAQLQATSDLSTNLGKWLARLTASIDALNVNFGGTPPVDGHEAQQQALIDQIATGLNLTADEIQAALNQPKTQGE